MVSLDKIIQTILKNKTKMTSWGQQYILFLKNLAAEGWDRTHNLWIRRVTVLSTVPYYFLPQLHVLYQPKKTSVT